MYCLVGNQTFSSREAGDGVLVPLLPHHLRPGLRQGGQGEGEGLPGLRHRLPRREEVGGLRQDAVPHPRFRPGRPLNRSLQGHGGG